MTRAKILQAVRQTLVAELCTNATTAGRDGGGGSRDAGGDGADVSAALVYKNSFLALETTRATSHHSRRSPVDGAECAVGLSLSSRQVGRPCFRHPESRAGSPNPPP